MSDSKFCWSEETYRLDELERSVGFPQLIQVTEGMDTGNDIDSFSAEDVLMIDQCVLLQKVAAQFAKQMVEVADSGNEYAILNEEILIPLNYKGKLKVMNPIRRYYNVRQLAKEFPRYATVLEAMRVPSENGGMLGITSDSKVELDRVIPGHKGECDRLVISTALGGRKQVAMPFDMPGKFRSCPDDNEYTLKEVVDRCSLPKIIQFLDNKIQKIYTQDLLEGVEQMANITGSALQINRLVLQKVLIGHYKEPGEETNQSEKFCKRTLVVIPLDSLSIREITVRIRLSNAEDDPIYEPFLVQNVNADKSDYVDMAEGLYVEFVKRPKIIRLKEEESAGDVEDDNDGEEEEKDEPPPPVPPRPGQPGHGKPPPVRPKPGTKPRKKPVPTPAIRPGAKSKKAKDCFDFSLDKEAISPTDKEAPDPDYEVPENQPSPPKVDQRGPSSPSPSPSPTHKSPMSSPSSTVTPKSTATSLSSLAGISFDRENVRKPKHKGQKDKHVLMNKLTDLFRKKSEKESTIDEQHHEKNPEVEDEIENNDENLYDEPDDVSDDYAGQTFVKQENLEQKPSMSSKEPEKGKVVGKQRPVAHVSPQTNTEHIKPKEFRLLKIDELKERLILCGMPEEFVKSCVKEQLDGEFMHGMDKEMMKTFNLSKYHEEKLKRVIAGWTPSS